MKTSARSTTSAATGFFASTGNIVWNRFAGVFAAKVTQPVRAVGGRVVNHLRIFIGGGHALGGQSICVFRIIRGFHSLFHLWLKKLSGMGIKISL